MSNVRVSVTERTKIRSVVADAPVSATALTGTVPAANLGSGTADNTTFLRGDGTWATPSGSGGLTQAQILARGLGS